MNTTIAERLKEFRLREGLTLEALGKRAGCSKGHIWEIEDGRTDPKASTIKRLADALGVDVDAFFACRMDNVHSITIRRFIHLSESDKDTVCNVINAFWEMEKGV